MAASYSREVQGVAITAVCSAVGEYFNFDLIGQSKPEQS